MSGKVRIVRNSRRDKIDITLSRNVQIIYLGITKFQFDSIQCLIYIRNQMINGIKLKHSNPILIKHLVNYL